MKKLLVLALVAVGIMLVPSTASAHFLTNSRAKPLAQSVCRAINNVPADENPYICQRVGAGRRRSAHAIDYPLSLYDPNDGERCRAWVRVRFRSSSSFSRRVIGLRHDCLADAFAGV